jgi:hypothetical protein
MLEYLSYILFFGVFIIFIIFAYIRLKFGFWAIQPVFHVYDISYMFKAPGIIDDSLPEKNKYTNFKDIKTIIYSELTNIEIQRFTNLIKAHYLQNKDNIFSPKSNNITPYFYGHNDKSFVSFYNEDNHMIDFKKGTTITDKKLVGAITSRPIYVVINNGHKEAKFRAYYVDYLCVDILNRKKGIAQQLIQTHHYNQRRVNKNIVVSLFKREDELTGIVPLCVYSTYGFPVKTWTKPHDLSKEYSLIEVNAQNFYLLFTFIEKYAKKFDIVINSEVTNIIELIKTKNIFINTLIVDDEIVCAYFFRKSCVQVEKGMEVLSCFASISNTNDTIFIQCFKISFWKIASENNFGFCAIEDISDNGIIINNIKSKTKPLIVSPTAYFFYNFGYPTFKSNKVLIIN